MTNEHTPEPWEAHSSGRLYSASLGFIASTNLTGSSQTEIEANARRIVACVNSCTGIATDFLEAFGDLNPVILEGVEMKKQRDELLAALKLSMPLLRGHQETDAYKARYAAAVSAIAKAEQP